MVESTPFRQRRPPCKTNKEESDEAADAAALTYLLNPSYTGLCWCECAQPEGTPSANSKVLVCLPTCLLQGGVAKSYKG